MLITLVSVRNCRRLNSAGGPTEPTGPANIHVTKSPGTLHPRTARRIRSVKTPRPLSLTPARRHIHTSKSPHGLCQHNLTYIHASKSQRPMPTSIAQRNIEASKSPGFMPTSIARWNIHTAKSPWSMPPRIPGYWHRIRIDDPLCAEPLPVRQQRQR